MMLSGEEIALATILRQLLGLSVMRSMLCRPVWRTWNISSGTALQRRQRRSANSDLAWKLSMIGRQFMRARCITENAFIDKISVWVMQLVIWLENNGSGDP